MPQIHMLFRGLGRGDLVFISTTLLRFRHAFPNRMHQYGNQQACEEDADETDQDGYQSSERAMQDNIAVADGQPRDKGKVQRICEGHFFNEGDRRSTGHYQSDQHQNDSSDMPDSMKEMIGETG